MMTFWTSTEKRAVTTSTHCQKANGGLETVSLYATQDKNSSVSGYKTPYAALRLGWSGWLCDYRQVSYVR